MNESLNSTVERGLATSRHYILTQQSSQFNDRTCLLHALLTRALAHVRGRLITAAKATTVLAGGTSWPESLPNPDVPRKQVSEEGSGSNLLFCDSPLSSQCGM